MVLRKYTETYALKECGMLEAVLSCDGLRDGLRGSQDIHWRGQKSSLYDHCAIRPAFGPSCLFLCCLQGKPKPLPERCC